MKSARILVIGVGYFARNCYVPFLLNEFAQSKSLVATLDINSQRELLEGYFDSFENAESVTNYFMPDGIDKQSTHQTLELICQKRKINSVIISTNPENHLEYILWALNKGLNVLVDKLLTLYNKLSSDLSLARKLYEDYLTISPVYEKAKRKNPNLVFNVMVQRRYHPAYQLIKSKVIEVIGETGCPVTNMQSKHSDGQWRLPNEVIEMNYHGYNQGSGKVSHSGYHFVDFLATTVDTARLAGNFLDETEVYTNPVFPNDVLGQLNYSKLGDLFGSQFERQAKFSESEFRQTAANYGEVDVNVNAGFYSAGDLITNTSLQLIHNGLSNRGSLEANKYNLYKGNGRLRQESHYIAQGPFQAIEVESYQSTEKPAEGQDLATHAGENHFDIHVYRNTDVLIGHKRHEVYSIRDIIPDLDSTMGHMNYARIRAVDNFLGLVSGKQDYGSNLSSFETHKSGILLMSLIYQSIAARRQGNSPVIRHEYI